MELYLIRHAQSLNNAKPEAERVEDPGLTEVGHAQAGHLADWIRTLELTRLITSPFRRTLLTAEPLRRATGLTPEVRVTVHEQGGCYRGHVPGRLAGRPGMTRAEIEREFPEFDAGREIDGTGWWKSQPYETRAAAALRAAGVIEHAHREFAGSGERVGVVTHADFKLLLLEHIHGEPLDVPRNVSVTKILLTPAKAVLADYNRVDHLPSELVTF